MERRVGLAILALGALSVAALAQSQSVVTLPLKPPPQPEAEEEVVSEKPAPKPTKQTAAVSTKPAEPLAPQALFTLPPPTFTTEPLFPANLTIDPDSLPPPEIDRALLEARERAATMPPTPRAKPVVPALIEKPASAATEKATPRRRGVMEPIDDYRPPPRSSVVVDPSALERTLLPAKEKPAAAPPMPRAKPAPVAGATPSVAIADETRSLRRGVMEPIDDYRPGRDSRPETSELVSASEKPAKTLAPQPKPALSDGKTDKKPSTRSAIMPVDDAPGSRSLKEARGKAPTFRCFVRNVIAHYDRTQVRCYNKAKGKLYFFAVDTKQPVSAMLVSKGLVAMQKGQPVTIAFAPEADLNPANCAPVNCRRLIDIQN